MDQYNRTISISLVCITAGWFGYLGYDISDICNVLDRLGALVGVYVVAKEVGRGVKK